VINHSGPFPRQPGTYLLILDLDRAVETAVGRLGICHLPAGRWIYAGSALGPGGLAGRISRHFRQPARHHWHIDYLTSICAPSGAVYALGETRLECTWVQILRAEGAEALVVSFGNGDCRSAGCPAHLLQLPVPWTFQQIEDLLWTTSS
jgi:Uri superfamily endonuclease